MITLTNLAAEPTEITFTERRGAISTVHHEITPGCFVNLALGPAGLRIHRGDCGIAISTADLVALALAHAPELQLDPAAPPQVQS